MQWIQVSSTAIDALFYELKKENLFVRFTTGKIYEYVDVSQKIYHDFLNAESKGKFFNFYIKNHYEYRRIL